MEDIKDVTIVGKGALGLLFGDLLARHLGPAAVTYLMDDARYERNQGFQPTVNGVPCELQNVRASEAVPADLVIVATKVTGLEQAIQSMAGAVGPETCIISVLNGLDSEERIAEAFGWDHVVLSVAQGMDAGFIGTAFTYTHPGMICMGPAPATAPGTVERIGAALEAAGIRVVYEPDIRRRLWVKFMLNVGINQTCMVYGGTYKTVVEPESEQLRCYVAAMREAMACARAEGVEVTEADLVEMVELAASLNPDDMPSMAQDRKNKKPSEVEAFAGTVIKLAEKHGILVPQNRWLYRRVHEIEAEY